MRADAKEIVKVSIQDETRNNQPHPVGYVRVNVTRRRVESQALISQTEFTTPQLQDVVLEFDECVIGGTSFVLYPTERITPEPLLRRVTLPRGFDTCRIAWLPERDTEAVKDLESEFSRVRRGMDAVDRQLNDLVYPR